MTDDDLKTLLIEREITPVGIDNFFDLAERLLDIKSVRDALARCDRVTLASLRIASEEARPAEGITVQALEARLIELGAGQPGTLGIENLAERIKRAGDVFLTDDHTSDGVIHPCPIVSRQFASWPPLSTRSGRDLVTTTASGPIDAVDNRHEVGTNEIAAERAFATVVEVSELVFDLKRHPVRELSRGGIALLDTKRLAAVAAVELTRVPWILSIASRAKLIATDSGRLLITEFGDSWLTSAITVRWKALAAVWLSEIAPEVWKALHADGGPRWGEGLRRYLDWLYPVSGARFHDNLARVIDGAEMLGIAAHGVLSAAGNRLVLAGVDDAATDVHASFPREVRHAYVQPDFTIISGGPLEPDVDDRLRRIANVESRALSTTYRVSSESLNRALALGETEVSILEFLTVVSLSGIPQPLEYLVRETAKYYGTVRVGELQTSSSPASYVRSDDAHLLKTALVDQALCALSLSPDGADRLVSSADRSTVFHVMRNARYPVATENARGDIVDTRSYRAVAPTPAPRVDDLDTAINRLRASRSSNGDPEAAWIARQLKRAIQEKAAVRVRFASPDGSTTESVLEPASIVAGRMRARDRDADIERTLPVSCITAVVPASAHSSDDS